MRFMGLVLKTGSEPLKGKVRKRMGGREMTHGEAQRRGGREKGGWHTEREGRVRMAHR